MSSRHFEMSNQHFEKVDILIVDILTVNILMYTRPIFLEIRNPWGKVMERSGLIFENFNFCISLDIFEFLRFG